MSDEPLSEAALRRLGRTPRQCVVEAMADGPDATRAEVSGWEHRYRRALKGLTTWLDQSTLALQQRPGGAAALARALARSEVPPPGGGTEADLRTVATRHADQVAEALRTDGVEAATALYDEVEAAHRRIHDGRLDLVSLVWSELVALGGRDALEDCLRSLADTSLMLWMATDRQQDLAARASEWAAVMRANFSSITVTQDADGVTFTSDPCGSCSRQILAGRPEALGLETVAPFAPEHVGPDAVTVYRAHVGLMHWLMPLERVGEPWPLIRCPRGQGTGPCSLTLAAPRPS